MADFVAVIRKAVDNLSENTPENRRKVYDKARAAIRRQLEAINPQPSDEVIARQLDKLDLAISDVESEHTEALPADMDETDALMAELESMVEQSPMVAARPPSPAVPAAAPPRPAAEPAPKPTVAPMAAAVAEAGADKAEERLQPPVSRPGDLTGAAHDEAFGLDTPPRPAAPSRQPKAQRGMGGMLAVVGVLIVLGAAAFAGWSYRGDIASLFAPSPADAPVAADQTPASDSAAVTPEPAAGTPQPEAPVSAETPQAEAPGDGAAPDATGKFTQRLNADGSETDPGPAEATAAGGPVEGRSVAGLTDPGPADEAVAEEATAEAPVAPQDATAPDPQPLGVQQKMILYEERLGQQSLEVKEGTVVWTLVSEPSGDGPDEQVIRGEINNPEKGLSALITIKRNTDASLPASHLIEVVFALPAEFDGGSIDQLLRVALKQTEADQGNPLVAVPAKITQDFYMVALNDLEEARTFNVDMLRQRNWIDIPVVYANGRQALITLEKGASGTEVFNQALDAWARAAP